MTVFFIFPHPDDESIFAGGLMLRHILAGDNVVWLCASYGERGGESKNRSPGAFHKIFSLAGKYQQLLFFQALAVYWLGIFRRSSVKLAKIRKFEAQKAATVFGVKKLIFLGIPDMRFGWNQDKITSEIGKQLIEEKPDIVYTMNSDGITKHPDHVSLSRCVIRAVNNMKEKRPQLRFVTVSKDLVEKYGLPLMGTFDGLISQKIKLTAEEVKIKRRAIASYESQAYLWKIFLDKYPELLEEECFSEA